MEPKSLGAIIKAAVLGGLFAALVVAVFHFFVTEPVIESAIALEELLLGAQETTGEELLVNRDAQRAGLFLGFVLYGLAWSLLFSMIYHLIQGKLATVRAWRSGLTLALLLAWSVAIFPFLKYPANPPGVGDPETIQARQILYLTFIGLSVANTVLTLLLHRYLSRSRSWQVSRPWRWAIVTAAFFAGAAALYVSMPANSDPIRMPGNVLSTFRILSIVGLGLFWGLFGGCFAWLMRADSTAGSRRLPAMMRR